jgi:4-phosphopantoate--beta-alanine ligase
VRELLVENQQRGVVATAGLIAHGRGEAFDYLLGERTTGTAQKAIRATAATLLTAKKPVISVNGNVAALVADDLVELAQVSRSKLEVNLFYRSIQRERKIRRLLEQAGARRVLGVGQNASAKIPELGSARRKVDPRGILEADAVLVPLEDGDRTEALVQLGKTVMTIDLNPLSRTAQRASITIVDNVVRAMPRLVDAAKKLKPNTEKCTKILSEFNNRKNLNQSILQITDRLTKLATQVEGPAPAGDET